MDECGFPSHLQGDLKGFDQMFLLPFTIGSKGGTLRGMMRVRLGLRVALTGDGEHCGEFQGAERS